ncbi:MAG: hypothetical protein MRY83_24905 [Flavobacteriales bacterium]|nr:hypothetical protein [Flavobacteriales bacterium]
MKTIKLICAVGIILSGLCVSCKKEPLPRVTPTPVILSTESFIFSRYHGMCAGEECVETFKLENGAIYEDTLDQYSLHNDNGIYDFIQHNGSFNQIADIQTNIPAILLNDTLKTYGIPDGADWGGYQVILNTDTQTYKWNIDRIKSNIPVDLHVFVDSLESKINQLQ